MHQTTTRSSPRRNVHTSDGSMGEETVANAFRKPIGPSARACIKAEIVEGTKIKTELARARARGEGDIRRIDGGIYCSADFLRPQET